MADALCGPSNPLQNFQKHTTVDRTLQQDRHLARHAPSEGFRSAARANVGALDQEFEAFEAGFNPLAVSSGLQHPRNARHAGFEALNHASPAAGWASDFQRLQISDTPPSIAHYRPSPQTLLQRGSQSTWQNDFMRQSSQSPRQRLQQSPTQQRYGTTMGGFGTQRPLRNGTLDSWVEQKQPQRYEDESFDEAAFERAFDAAKLQIIDQEEILAQQDGTQTDADMLRNGLDDRLAQTDHLLEEDRIGADIVPWQDPKQQEEPLGKDDPDELARTAGQLLDSVKDDQSAKFRESNFLALMRRLRDKEVVVEGDKMVDNSAQGRRDANSADDEMTGAIGSIDDSNNAGSEMSFGPIEGDVPLEQMDWDSYLTEDGAPYLNFDPSSLNFKNPNGVEAVTGSV